MPISIRKYVDITSGVGAGAAVQQRALIGRLFTSSNLLPPGMYAEFESAEEVGAYFGLESEQYLRAQFYFSWISKLNTRAKKISFGRWVETAVAPMVFGVPADYVLSNFTSVSAGSFNITMGANSTQITGVDLSAAGSLSAVASAVQAAIRLYTAGGSLFTSATVTYDATRKSFNLVGGATGNAPMEIAAGTTGTDIASRLGWLNGSIQADGAAAESITAVLTASAASSNNFASFLFMDSLSDAEVQEAAAWDAAQNVSFMFVPRVLPVDAQDYYDALKGYGGTGVTLAPLANEYPEMCPMIILAATDYTRPNSAQNYMYQSFPTLTPSVTDTTQAALYDSLRINYIGVTQEAGTLLAFYQDGVLMGGATDPVDMNTYANEIWLKSYLTAALMTLLLALPQISANDRGRAQVQATIGAAIELALTNGTISVDKPLSQAQITYITEITGSDVAWQQVQNQGWWLNVEIVQETISGVLKWVAKYLLIYSKDDAVRKIEGTNTLI